MPACRCLTQSGMNFGVLVLLLHRVFLTPLASTLAWVKARFLTSGELQCLVSYAPVVMFRYQRCEKNDGRFLFVSGAVPELCGVEAAEMLQDSRTFFDRVEEPDKQRLCSTIAATAPVPQRLQQDIRVKGTDGQVTWLRLDAKLEPRPEDAQEDAPAIWSGCMVDVSDIYTVKAKEEPILAAFERARALSPMGMWEYHVDNSKLILDAYALQMTDIPADESDNARQILWEQRCHPEDRGSLTSVFTAALTTGQLNTQFRVVHRDGSAHWLHSVGLLKTEVDGSTRMKGIYYDVTEDVLAARDFNAEQRNNETASLSKAMFLASMSHEIRSPLNGILGMLFLLSDSRLEDTQKQWVEDAKTSAQNLLAIINDILDLSKLEAGKLAVDRTAFSPEQVLRNIVSLFKHQARSKGITLEFTSEINKQVRCSLLNWSISMFQSDADFARRVACVLSLFPQNYLGDPVRFHQVASNLISNAVKFTGRGRVSVCLRVAGITHKNSNFSVLRVEVNDTGIGIRTDQLKYLFKPFSQSDSSITRRYGGTGLGLAISKELVELMGGQIGVDSEVGRGSTFWFELVLQKAAPATPAQPLRTRSQREVLAQDEESLHGLRILVADDSIVNQKLVSAYLSNTHCQLKHVLNGQEALDAVKAEDFDVVLMDIQMPVMDGLTAAREIRRLPRPKSDIYIIGLTASGYDDREATFAAGVSDFVTKPVTQHTLLDRIATAAQQVRKGMAQKTTDDQLPYARAS